MIEPAKFYAPETRAAAEKLWLDTPAKWEKLLTVLWAAHKRGEPTGIDSEFDGVDVSEQSCARRARLLVFSVAWLTSRMTPLGFRKAAGAVLPRAALEFPPVREWLTSPARKMASNSPVDAHAFENAGIKLGGLENTISLYRWMVPGQKSYGLDTATTALLRRSPFCTYTQLVTEEFEHVRITRKKARVCGTPGCRARDPMFHERRDTYVETPKASIKTREIPLEALVDPSHPRHAALVLYAADDAISSLEEYLALGLRNKKIVYPWSVNVETKSPRVVPFELYQGGQAGRGP
jgi:hypothetical protein